MRQDDRAPFDRALHRARVSAYGPAEFVGQESFMTAGEIRALALQAGIGPGVTVLDLCCGIAGPGRFLTRELGCAYLGVDSSASAVAIARERAGDLPCRFAVAQIPPLPAGPFDVVLLLETMLAFEDKDALVRAIAAALRPGGRLAFTLEEGPPLTAAERAAMPDADTVWLTPLDEVATSLELAGLVVTWQEDHSRAHRAVAQALEGAFAADAEDIAAQIGRRALHELLAAHRLWIEWLNEGRVRKFALVAERAQDARSAPAAAPDAVSRIGRWRAGKSTSMDPTRILAAALALNRIAFGANYLARPQSAGPCWIGRRAARTTGGRIMIRSQAARDIGLGAGAVWALAHARDEEARRWMTAHALADGVDTAATWARRKRLPKGGSIPLAIAGASTAVALLAARRLGRGRGSVAAG
jgi:SAM-dependent methyltransferase